MSFCWLPLFIKKSCSPKLQPTANDPKTVEPVAPTSARYQKRTPAKTRNSAISILPGSIQELTTQVTIGESAQSLS